MGNLLGGLGGGGGGGGGGGAMGGYGAANIGYGPELQCCPGVVDPFTLLGLLGAIAGVTLILRQVAIDNITGRKKRRRREADSLFAQYLKEVITEGESLLFKGKTLSS